MQTLCDVRVANSAHTLFYFILFYSPLDGQYDVLPLSSPLTSSPLLYPIHHILYHILFHSILYRFSTPFEAERAASECLTFLGSGLDSHVMLSCTQLTAALARTLDLQIDSSGALTRGQGAGQGVTSSPFPTSRHTESQSRQERKPEGGLDLT